MLIASQKATKGDGPANLVPRHDLPMQQFPLQSFLSLYLFILIKAIQKFRVETMNQQKALMGSAFHQFIAVSTLLSLLDPVRGKPTVHSLDRHPDDSAGRHDYLQTRFLDSFALICSTARKGGETASAVCFERDPASGTILRLSRNRGVPRDLINRLQPVLDKLMTIARRGVS